MARRYQSMANMKLKKTIIFSLSLCLFSTMAHSFAAIGEIAGNLNSMVFVSCIDGQRKVIKLDASKSDRLYVLQASRDYFYPTLTKSLLSKAEKHSQVRVRAILDLTSFDIKGSDRKLFHTGGRVNSIMGLMRPSDMPRDCAQ